MKYHTRLKIWLCSIASTMLLVTGVAQAQLRVEVAGVGSNQVPVAIAGFADEGIMPVQVTQIIKDDLNRSGYFKIIDLGVAISESATVNFESYRARGAEALVVGSVTKLAEGRFEVRYKLYDTNKATMLSGFGQDTPNHKLRLSAHKIADDIHQKLLGVPGIFSTRIAYVTKAGKEFRLEIADADGENIQVALRSQEPIMSPSWSPDGTKLAYVSFEARKPVIFVQNLITGQRTMVANFKGNNSAPAWSPDGTQLALALSKDSVAQIYLVNADGGGVTRLTTSNSIDTEPQFSADGQFIYFLSDRSGGPQIYRMNRQGADIKRMTFNGTYNITPRISPDGTTLAYISRRDGKFQLYSMDINSAQELRLSDTTNDEYPSFSPNGRYIMYATASTARGSLAIVSTDGRVKTKISIQAGDIRQPTWGPFMK
jgi:TolB protein